ncbi:MAG: hypothetical protein DWH82_10965 [Planctomycetota bacterium]|nr:MAG: hypothetical protein DWH82_10965 [Planctomycetota bacterium]
MALLACLKPESPADEALRRVMGADDIPAEAHGLTSSAAAALWVGKNPAMAIRLIAGWLSTREAIWWGALCQAQLVKVNAAVGPHEVLTQVVNWVREPVEHNREVLGKPGRGDSSPIGLMAQGVVLTLDNLSPLKDHPVACPAGLAHRMTGLAVLAAASRWPGRKRADCLNHFVALGVDVADGLHLWADEAMDRHAGLRLGSVTTSGTHPSGNIWEKWQ